ncbi:MAG: phosphoribosylformylglycinamidine synthase subunit PurQ [Bacteriovoracia bacterium]
MPIRAIVLSGDGINCEQETAQVCQSAGFEVDTVHVNDLLAQPTLINISRYKLLVVPGGFSFGDELGSGRLLALKLKFGLKGSIDQFTKDGGLVLGICNGFQVLTRLGLFGSNVALVENSAGRFINRWVGLEIVGDSVFTKGLSYLELPMRHGEGRLVKDKDFVRGVVPVFRYSEDVNGSFNQIAGLSSFEGRVLGLMPHPEAFWTKCLHPESKDLPLGRVLFDNAFSYLKERA